jgi:hypothetical protein
MELGDQGLWKGKAGKDKKQKENLTLKNSLRENSRRKVYMREDSGKRNSLKGSVCKEDLWRRWSAVTGVNVGASSGILETDRREIHSGPWSGISSTYKHRYSM